jgi:hypothetical protein
MCLQRFLSPFAAMTGVEAARPDAAAAELRKSFGLDAAAPIETIVATVADPIESGLDYDFESELAALELAVEHSSDSSKLSRAREWLPWDDRTIPEASRGEVEACRATTPGIVLFRTTGVDRPRLFALLIVGESPATGLREAALLNALQIADVLEAPQQTLDACVPQEPVSRVEAFATTPRIVRVVGPTFSGSAESLRRGLARWAEEHPDELVSFQVITGSATGSEVPGLLGNSGTALGANGSVSFRTTTEPDSATECAYLWLLKRRFSVAATGAQNQLRGVATLHESGTEFGKIRTKAQPECKWSPSVTMSFPFHISALRDAYEHLSGTPQDSGIARRTSLPVSLREKHVPLDIEAEPSDKTKAALDLTLANVLGQISRSEIHDVAIHATDVGDAIFLAQRIRDVAPDVRLAFFDADMLLAAPEYRRELLGSLVVTPYPFLGVQPFAWHSSAPLLGFQNSTAEGVYNALLAQLRAGAESLREYTFDEGQFPLPVWVSTVSRGGIEPLSVTPAPDCDGNVYGTQYLDETRRVCAKHTRKAWDDFNQLRVADFALDPELRLPHLWDLAYVFFLFGFFIDVRRQKRLSRTFDSREAAALASDSDDRDRRLENLMIRAKWRLYAAIRSFLFVLLFSYMGAVYFFAWVARGVPLSPVDSPLLNVCYVAVVVAVIVASWVLAVVLTYRAGARYLRDYFTLGRGVGGPYPWSGWESNPFGHASPPSRRGPSVAPLPASDPSETPEQAHGFLDRLSLGLGTTEPTDWDGVVRTSFAQLRTLTGITLLLSIWFIGWVVADAVSSTDWALSRHGALPVPALSLLVLRNTSLANGVSSAAAALLCMVSVYVWCVGRMARLVLAYRTTQQCPPDGVADLVSTPIRVVLHPRAKARPGSRLVYQDDGFTDIERDVLNAIFRPITGPYYPLAAIALFLFPVVLFTLKPLRTIEGGPGTILLGSGLALCVFLIGVTLIQLVQYWLALERLLKRTMEHRLGPAFRTVAPFARDSIDHLVSRTPNDVLRWTAACRQFSELVQASAADALTELLRDDRNELVLHSEQLEARRRGYLERKAHQPGASDTKAPAEAELGRQLVCTASLVLRILASKWTQTRFVPHALPVPEAQARPMAAGEERGSPALIPLPPTAVARQPTPVDPKPQSTLRAEEDRTSDVAVAARHGSPVSSDFAPSGTAAQRRRETSEDSESESHKPADDDPFTSLAFRYDGTEIAWLRSAESFVATVSTLLVHRHVRQFRYFLYVLTACSLLLLLIVTSYPFEPYRLLLSFTWVVMGSIVATCLWVYVELERNTLLSLTAGTKPNNVTVDATFVLRVLTWGVVPLLSIAATQYPEVANFLFNLVSPFARALH